LPIQVVAAASEIRQSRLEDGFKAADLVSRQPETLLELIRAPPGEASRLGGLSRGLRPGLDTSNQAGRYGHQPGAQHGPSNPPIHP